MFTVRSLYLLALFVLIQTTLARPLRRSNNSGKSRNSEHSFSNGSNRQSNDIVDAALFTSLTQSVTFNTVTTTETQSGTITQLCQVTLTPLVVNGIEIVRQDKTCKLQVDGNNGNNGNNNNNGGNGNGNNTSTTTSAENSTTTTESSTSTSSSFTSTTFSSTATASAGTVDSGVSVIGASSSAVNSGNGGFSTTFAGTTISTTAAAAATSVPPAVSVIGVNIIPNSGTAVEANNGSATGTLPVTAVTTLSDGSVSTSVTTPSAAAANAPQAAAVPGRKLEVLPIGLGVFAGVSVIALIVVGLVTYERTKYRKAFRQRKLAEAGANMGYGGMAERT